MSSQQSAATVAQLVDALAPYPVVVHHDFDKRRDFELDRPNVELVPDPKVTGWGTWGFAEAIFHTISHALARHDFDYFQLLSPTCLPIRPLEDFAAHVAADGADINADTMPVDGDDDVLMTFGYRTYIPGRTLRFRLMRRARGWYFGQDADLVQTHSLSVMRRRQPVAAVGPVSLRPRAGLALTRLVAGGRLSSHPFGPDFKPMIGSVWFGAKRAVCEHLTRLRGDEHALEFFRNLHIVDETLFPTLLANSGFRMGPSNHAISPFDDDGHPRWIEEADFARVVASRRFFARKFPDDPQATVRRRALALMSRPEPVPNP
ncbi:MAG TPA: beta-1,6-N-acetylglucosaminyltransferase [Burkholderiaceae bacterium]|nr:beta-1,6-N-acetylglucosaminyltransferase [Burkholderiaceae bacterium]